ncbi:MAG: YfhO family protein [Solirubrobacteraceae bacterium]
MAAPAARGRRLNTRTRRVSACLRARPALAAALLYALLALLFVSPAFLPGKVVSTSDAQFFQAPWVSSSKPPDLVRPANPEIDDAPTVFQPFIQYSRRELPDVPLWNPYIQSGRPFEANAQSAIFSPYSLPAYVLPFYDALEWIIALKLFVAAFGTFLLGRALGMRFGGAFLAGLVYGFNLWMVTWLAFPHSGVWTLIPWMLFLTERLVRRPDRVSAVALAAVTGLQFAGGHPESSFHALVATVCFFSLRTVQAARGPDRPKAVVRRAVLCLGAALAAGVALAAVVLLPLAELLLHSADIHQRAGTAAGARVPERFVLGAALPDYWGRPTQTPLELFLLARAVYAGALALLLALAALILRPRAERMAIAGFDAACLLVVYGVPPVFEAVTALPGFSGGHNGRLVVLYMLSVALLAGWGLDELTQRRPEGRRRTVLAGVAVALVAAPAVFVAAVRRTSWSALGDALEIAWGLATPPPATDVSAPDVIRGSSLILWLTFGGASLALIACRVRRGLAPALFIALASLLVAADLFRAGMGYNPAIERRHAEQPATGAIRYLQSRRPARFVTVGYMPYNVIPQRFGLYEARGYDVPIERRYDRFWRLRLSPELPSEIGEQPLLVPLQLPRVTPERLRYLSLLGVTDILQPLDDPPLRLPGLRLAYSGPDARVYAFEAALPRAWVVPAQTVVDGGEGAFRAIGRAGFDPRATAVVERRVDGLPLRVAGAGGGVGAAEIEDYQPDRVTVRARADREALLVLSDNYYPGWRARVDGRDEPVERVDYLLRGVRIGPGVHTVEFRFEPLTWRIGWIVSLLALCALAGALVTGLRTRRTGRHTS